MSRDLVRLRYKLPEHKETLHRILRVGKISLEDFVNLAVQEKLNQILAKLSEVKISTEEET